jgi:biopolymer transport protein ExbB
VNDGLWPHFLRLEDYFAAGGPVMVPLAAVSLVMWLLIADRALFFWRLNRQQMSAPAAWEHIQNGRRPDPARFRGAISVLVHRYLARRSNDPLLNRFILDEAVLGINRSLDNYLAVIGVLAVMAPLMGLLGTVTGMIGTFQVLSLFGRGNAEALAGGISEALVTTQTGLLVAIPGMAMKGILERRALTLKQHIAHVGFYLRRQL